MIISHKHKFIFLKTVKTAGTSIQAALAEHCGKEDIITGKEVEQNIHKLSNIPILHHEHVYLTFVKQWLEPEIWDSYFKFAFIRNPFDLAISKYYWDYKNNPQKFNFSSINQTKNFQNWVKDGQLYGSLGVKETKDGNYIKYEHTFYPWLCNSFHYEEGLARINPNINPYDKGIDVDFVGRYEQLNEDMDYVGKKLGLKLKLPKLNANTRDKSKKIHEYYDEETMYFIEDYFKYDLDKFWKKDNEL